MNRNTSLIESKGSPYISRRVHDRDQRFFGAVDFIDPTAGIRGWAYDTDNFGKPLRIEVQCGGDTVAVTYALLERPDLDSVLGVRTSSSFIVGWSRFDRDRCEALANRSPDAPVTCWVPAANALMSFVVDAPSIGTIAKLAGTHGANEFREEFALLNDYLDIVKACVFDSSWYEFNQLADPAPDPLLHYLTEGERHGLAPNLLFVPSYYVAQRGGSNTDGALVHYVRVGERAGLAPSPHFDPTWYQEAQALDHNVSALGHWLTHRSSTAPNPWFDPVIYQSRNPDLGELTDPYDHYVTKGALEGLSASDAFDAKTYRAAYLADRPEVNPFLHFLGEGRELGHWPHSDITGPDTAHEQLTTAASMGRDTSRMATAIGEEVRVVAFYLPQFHPIPENDAAWGEGFTEWTNVTKAKPLFEGHHQPQLPAEIGFYDLRVPAVMEKQSELAKAHGIHGFCFYVYWFDGRRLLEKPLEQMLTSGKPDMPFCLAWANENWTRRWDGSDQEIIVAQTFAPEFRSQIIDDFMPYFCDARYIRIDGKPVFIVYRPDIVPDLRETLALWRRHAAEQGIQLYLVACLTFGFSDPLRHGFDAGLEFPPHGVSAKNVSDSIEWNEPFAGLAYRYDEVVSSEIGKPERTFPVIRSCMAGWDNTARRGSRAHIFLDSSPEKFATWLSALVHRSILLDPPDRRFVFVNAWNEWAEGAHLEPDDKYGRRWLMAVSRAVRDPGGEIEEEIEAVNLNIIETAARRPDSDPTLRVAHQILTRTRHQLARSEALTRALSTHFAARLRDEHWGRAHPPVLLSRLGDIDLSPAGTEPLGWVDYPATSLIMAERSMPLHVSGWLLHPSTGSHLHGLLVATLTPAGGHPVPIVLIVTYGLPRPDLLASAQLSALSGARDCGFELFADLRELKPGRYHLRIGVADMAGTEYLPIIRDVILL